MYGNGIPLRHRKGGASTAFALARVNKHREKIMKWWYMKRTRILGVVAPPDCVFCSRFRKSANLNSIQGVRGEESNGCYSRAAGFDIYSCSWGAIADRNDPGSCKRFIGRQCSR